MNTLALGGILKRVYSKFDMGVFADRVKLQKIIYLLQAKDINLGYIFSWYVYGPYSTGLAKDAFQIDDFSQLEEVGFADNKIESKFKEFIEFIEPNKEDHIWLEIASSIDLLKKMSPLKTKTQIITEIQNKREELKKKKSKIEKVWTDIDGWLI